MVSAGQLCNNLLHKLLVPARLREGPHVLEVANAKALRNQGIPFPDPGKPINDFGSEPSAFWRERISRPIDR